MARHTARCHCGAVVIEAQIDLSAPTFRCNCSICRRTRFWAAISPGDSVRVLEGEDALASYTFNGTSGGQNEHRFCRHCGVRVYGIGRATPMGLMHGVNVGCIDGLDDAALAALTVVRVDGLHERWDAEPAHPAFL